MKNLVFALLSASLIACGTKAPSEDAQVVEAYVPKVFNGSNHVDWSVNGSIYELNTRQFSESGKFVDVLPHLQRIKDMGIKTIWFMPIQPIGKLNRKGGLGSYYSIADYTAINPEYGTAEDFQTLVDSIHALDMKVVLDWVANHTAWDNKWVAMDSSWYEQDSLGNLNSPFDWTDVIALNYDSEAMQNEMIKSMRFWVTEFGVDGFRCDVAMEVPTSFWNKARASLDSIQPIFMLAEAEEPAHHEKAFDMSYAWEFHHISKEVANGHKPLTAIDTILEKDSTRFGSSAMRLMFITNHDENSWNGTVAERYGANADVSQVLMYTVYGTPLVYSGQESVYEHRLAFFDKDTIQWRDYSNQELITRLLHLHQRNSALWGGATVKLGNNQPTTVYSFERKADANQVVVLLNYGAETTVELTEPISGNYLNVITNEQMALDNQNTFTLPANGYLVLEKQ